jgi:hypothetical protein
MLLFPMTISACTDQRLCFHSVSSATNMALKRSDNLVDLSKEERNFKEAKMRQRGSFKQFRERSTCQLL